MRKDEALRIVTACAKRYAADLADRNLLFVYGSSQAPRSMACYFAASNYLHLTGILFSGTAADFYRQCLYGRLSSSRIKLAANGTTELKLRVLPQVVSMHTAARMIGDYDGTKSLLYTEKIVGSTTACVGFIRKGGFHIPNTALCQDIRDVTATRGRVLAVFRRTRGAALYGEVCYVARGVDLACAGLANILREKTSL